MKWTNEKLFAVGIASEQWFMIIEVVVVVVAFADVKPNGDEVVHLWITLISQS